MSAAGCVDVMISGVPAQFCRVDPAFQPKCDRMRCGVFYLEGLGTPDVLRSARVFDGVLAWWQCDGLTISPINLRLKEKVRSKTLGLRWVYTLPLISDQE